MDNKSKPQLAASIFIRISLYEFLATKLKKVSGYNPFSLNQSTLAILLYGFILALPLFLKAQSNEFTLERFTTEDGLPNESINSITQDQEGFLWVATQEGLVKYDGYQFQTYRNIPGDSSSINYNRIEALYVDHTGDLWVGTATGFNRYESGCDCFFRYSSNPSDPNDLTPGQVNTFTEDKDKNLWVGTQEGGLFCYERESDHFTRFLDDPNDPNTLIYDEVRTLLVDQKNRLWIGTGEPFGLSITGGGLIRFDLNTGKKKRFLHNPASPNSLIDNRVSALFEDKAGRLYAGTCQNGLHYFDPEKEEFIRIMPDPNQPNRLHAPQGTMGKYSSCPHVKLIHENIDGIFWVGTFNGGLHRFDPITKKLSQFVSDPTNPASLTNNMIFSFYEDRQGRLWIGNIEGGLHKYDKSLQKFNVYVNKPGNFPNLSFNDLIGIYEAPKEPGIIWIGTRGGGLNRLDTKTNQFIHYRHDPDNENSISNDVVWTTYEDRSGIFWVGTESGLDQLDRQTGKFRHIKLGKNDTLSLSPIPVISIFEDKESLLWIGTWSGGLIRFDRQKREFKTFNFDLGMQPNFDNSIYTIQEDSKGILWVSTWMGALYRYDPQKESFSTHLSGYGALSFYEDTTGKFWIGTENKGLLHFNPNDDSFEQYTSDNGLPSNNIVSIFEDDHGLYWLSTGNGISKFDPASKSFTNYDMSDGLPSNTFSRKSGLKTRGGQLFFGGNRGLVYFFPDQVKDNPFPPDVLITGLQISGQSYASLNTLSSNPEEIELNFHQNDLTFEFVGLHFTDPSKNEYQYKLEPYDANWVAAGTQRSARYTNLDPGKYNFKVIASNSDGLWNEIAASLEIVIHPPWWLTWWAKTIYALLFLGVLYSIRHLELQKQQRKLEREQEKLAQQQRVNAVTSKFVPNAFIHSLGRKDIMDVKLGDAVAQEVTVMFSDIRDYTTLSENMTPEENFRFVNNFNQKMGPVIQRNQGFVNQYLGDAIMALFKNAPVDGLRAAIQMQQTLTEYNRTRIAKDLSPIRLGIGLHTGPLIMGIIGDDQRMDAATISDTVNTASRIESLTKYFNTNILLSEESLQQIQQDGLSTNGKSKPPNFNTRFLGSVLLKGKKEPVGIYECFDGDLPEIIEKKGRSQSVFKAGMDFYFSMQFEDATAAFKKVLEINAGDQTARFFLEKSTAYLANGVPEDWTGVEVMTFK